MVEQNNITWKDVREVYKEMFDTDPIGDWDIDVSDWVNELKESEDKDNLKKVKKAGRQKNVSV